MVEKNLWRFSTTCCFLLLLTFCRSESLAQQATLTPLLTLEVLQGDSGIEGEAVFTDEASFTAVEGIPNLGVTTRWNFIRWKIEQTEKGNSILLDNPALDSIKVFHVTPFGYNLIAETGEGYRFNELNQTHTALTVPIPADSSDGYLYFGIWSAEQVVVPLFTGTAEYIDSVLQKREVFYAIYIGLIIALLLYNLFIFLTVRDRIYIYYVFYILTVGLTQLILNGYANKYIWPSNAAIGIYASAIVPILSGWAVIVFARHFILTRVYAPWIDKILLVFAGLYGISFICTLIGKFDIAFNIINANASAALILVPAAIKGIRKGYRPAGFFLIAFAFFLIGVTLFALRNFGVVPFNDFTTYALPIGSAFEAVLLSFALADRINQFKKEKEESQKQAIEVMKENQRLIEQQNVQLEAMVQERTLDLARTNDELNTTLNDLRITQKQLLESEKLASLGQMTAGIAHEINNPINFVQSNVLPLRRDIDDTLSLLDDVAALEKGDQLPEKVDGLIKKYHELDMPYVRKEITQLLEGIEEGSRRTAEIVKGLRVFSRMDRETQVAASINDCLQSTLIVMKNVTNGEVTLIKELDENLPPVHCFPGQLNQVFANVLINAVHATELPGRTEKDRIIHVSTSKDDSHILITIEDNGTGIPESIRSRIFDPFFTTKKVGQGTGLGLSIALGIVEEHKGRIDVHSEQGQGTRVLVSLPLDNPSDPSAQNG